MKKFIKGLSVLFLAVLVLSSCSKASNENTSQISFSGSSTLAPVISKISTDFIEKNTTWDKVDAGLPKENITIFVSSGGSGAGVKAVLDGVSNFGMLARDVKDSEKEKIKDFKSYTLGKDALCIAVHPDNNILKVKNGNITKEELIKIFSGEIKTWKELDDTLPAEEIVVVTRDLSGGAHEVFQKKIMKDVKVREDVIQAPSMGALVSKIIENKNAIGYASFGITNQNRGKLIPLKVDGIEATEENILNGSYYISRPLVIVKSGELSATEKAFVDVLLSEEGKKIIKEMGFIPVDK